MTGHLIHCSSKNYLLLHYKIFLQSQKIVAQYFVNKKSKQYFFYTSGY